MKPFIIFTLYTATFIYLCVYISVNYLATAGNFDQDAQGGYGFFCFIMYFLAPALFLEAWGWVDKIKDKH